VALLIKLLTALFVRVLGVALVSGSFFALDSCADDLLGVVAFGDLLVLPNLTQDFFGLGACRSNSDLVKRVVS
jgi:hypothetical protein